MKTLACLTGGLATLAVIAGTAADFPLALKTVDAARAWTLPGGSGSFSQLETRKPSQLKNESKAVSSYPLYGSFSETGQDHPMIYRLDESKGTGKGYDTLLLDQNGNGDLTDDTSFTSKGNAGNTVPSSFETANFGPISALESQCAGIWRPANFAQMTVYNRSLIGKSMPQGSVGYLRMRSGCYLETTVTLEGRSEKLAFMDGNGNMGLGDRAKTVKYRNANEDSWYFRDGDVVLRDRDGSGSYESDQFDTESEPLSDYLYIGPNPYRLSFSGDFKVLRLELCAEPMGEIAFEPHGEQVSYASIARETKPDQWELISPMFVSGKAKVPAGKYRLYGLQLTGKNANGVPVFAGAYNRGFKTTIEVAAGKTAVMKCGGPLELKVTANKQGANGNPGGVMGAALSLFGGNSGSSSGSEVAINMAVTGAGGESYSGYVKGQNRNGQPPLPVFKIFTADGKQVANGNLEFG
jgi:hypothetical protein